MLDAISDALGFLHTLLDIVIFIQYDHIFCILKTIYNSIIDRYGTLIFKYVWTRKCLKFKITIVIYFFSKKDLDMNNIYFCKIVIMLIFAMQDQIILRKKLSVALKYLTHSLFYIW